MKAYTCPVALLTLFMVQSCSIIPKSGPAHYPATLSNSNSIQPQPFIIRGQVVLGAEVRSLTPCGSTQQYWLQLSQSQLKMAETIETRPYQPMYAEVFGYLTEPASIGSGAGYSAKFVVDNINYLSKFKYSLCDAPTKPTRAFGSQPNWSLSFSPNEVNINIASEPTQQVRVIRSSISPKTRSYQLDNGQLILSKQACTNQSQQFLTSWIAKLRLNQETYQGCSILANTDVSSRWVGSYAASSTKKRSFSVTLQLRKDHFAQTTYRYSDGQADRVETGYWQQLNASQVQVIMTHLQRQNLLSQRIFTWNGHKLIAKQEKVANVLYSIADGGLTLYPVQK
ncbi:hypothetical protein M9194_19205 [Vibrio sp. S4M6]|uniref:hypothetical protein n=1 Tax=Vibrio sinus TaxID=2946865 RepID=UPI002029CCFF|nr:hypothetical protein [Vibrio sinus]MCL9783554.1 hypothetical protein [Vibrio sinus]